MDMKDGGNYYKYWIGAHDIVREKYWFWSDGQNFKYDNWARGQPEKNPFLNEDCGMIFNDARRQWHDTKCYFYMRYICKKITYKKDVLVNFEPETTETTTLEERDSEGIIDEFATTQELNLEIETAME